MDQASKDTPGKLNIVVSADKMTAAIKLLTAPSGECSAVTREDVAKALDEQKIVFGINQEAIDEAAANAAAGQEQKNTAGGSGKPLDGRVIARGTKPRTGEDARISLAFETGELSGTVDENTGRIDSWSWAR